MTITYTWAIPNMKCEDTDNDGDCSTIKQANWVLTGTDGTNTSSISGSIPLTVSMAGVNDPEELFATLTEAEVITDVQTVLGVSSITSLETNIANDLYAKSLLSPVLPWVV
jgi:hypothetical protein